MGKNKEHRMIDDIECKNCYKCGEWLPLSEFSKDKSAWDGLQHQCNDCLKQYRAEHADEHKKYMKQWYADNAEHKKQYSKQWYSTIEGYARSIRYHNLQKDRRYGRIAADEDPLPPIEEYIELLQQRDYYDGRKYHWSEMGLDRIDNSKPHTIDNIVPCSTAHNVQRGRKSFEEFCELMRKQNELELVL